MAGQTVRLVGPSQRTLAHQLIEKAPQNAIVNIKEETRSNEQNSMLWSLLSDISRAKPQGRVLEPDLWKCLFMSACGHKVRFEPDLEGDGVVPIGFRSSRLNKSQLSELLECIMAFGAEHNIRWSDQ